MPFLVGRSNHQIHNNRGTHDPKANTNKTIQQGHIGDMGHDVADHNLVGRGGQDPTKDTLMRSPSEDRSIQNTDHESTTIKPSGNTINRTMKKD